MAVTPLDSALFGSILSDADLADLFSDEALLREMVAFERALARAEGRAGAIPADAAKAIDGKLKTYVPEAGALADGAGRAGVPVPTFVAALRAKVGGKAGAYVHWGATSQDVMDTALVLQLRAALDRMERRLAAVIAVLCRLADAHRGTVMLGRTRGQQATPTTFGLKAAGWFAPLVRQRMRLVELRPRLLVLSFGGAVGNLSALGELALAVEAALAEELDLAVPPLPWHAQRDTLAELAAWCAILAGSLGKIGQDVILLSQNEVGEVREGGDGRGGSSTMPNKSNPARAEAIVALARFVAGLSGQMQQALVHAHERDGGAWQMEWLTLPQTVVGTGAALAHAESLLADLIVDPARMNRNIAATNGLVLAEAASFALAAHMPRPKAQDLVKTACKDAAESSRHLVDILMERVSKPVDWATLRDPAKHVGAADVLIDRALAFASGVDKG
jgi:3-carboxy-cis,cis-muconate cycloisomerase